ncbi:response regulator transcription factor [Catellatospora bangladeshensis]|uniref:Mycobacterial persistence regulator MrpA (Two component response transcriptional regulatory protein) n=1 Tax=Catellatospora bangladeshensis TaxID=310355 RepID=A0A8J3JFZ8_9ACTN|nr:response regulator transcription factor [Catellatospora bangladeshensis]GIF81959.1 Mycobacterial persistence regulator MrpA (two component response transcriptional regulatory protein) [Catellatospora bangladeshensis]
MTPGSQVLVADDDASVRQSLDRALRLEGYTVHLAADGAEALAKTHDLRPDLLLLDVMMPVLDGLDTCRRLRQAADHTPVLMLTARDAVADRVAGLDAGADDYLVKPFALQELLARIRALLRRTTPAAAADDALSIGDLTLNRSTRQVRRGDVAIELTRTEFSLLQTLLEHQGRVLSRAQLFEHVWGFDLNQSSNSLDVYIGYLRRKLEADDRPRLLHTVRGVGFVLRSGEQRP